MDIQIAKERIFYFASKLSGEQAQAKAFDKKLTAFDTVSKVTSFFSKSSNSDFELIYSEHRYQPFWHVAAKSRYVYDRTADYQVPASTSEVQSVTLQGQDYGVTHGHLHLSVMEHCLTESSQEVFVDGVTGKNIPSLSSYLNLSPILIEGQLDKLVPKGSILVPPTARVSAIMRQTLAQMIQGIQADKIMEEKVEVTSIDLYYHPIYAFQYRWLSKNKEAIIEVDGVTGEIRSGERVFSEYLGRILDQNFLFDLGADAAGMFIPGGSIAVKVAKKYLDTQKAKGK